jgi:hypothetical protein
MGMNVNRAVKLQGEFLQSAQDVMANCIHFQLTHEDILEHLNARIFSRPEWKKVPSYVQAYINGWLRCKYDSIYQDKLVWVLSVDDKLLLSKEVDALTSDERFDGKYIEPNYQSPWARVNNDLSRHVWKNRVDGSPMLQKPYDRRFQKNK